MTQPSDTVGARAFARIETPESDIELSKREFDELRMLLAKAQNIEFNANPPVFKSTYDELEQFASDAVSDDGYLDE